MVKIPENVINQEPIEEIIAKKCHYIEAHLA